VTDSARAFRPDVEGLRGVAILLVLLFHGTSVLPGGFIGVDVFFVISGFLITDLLLRELESTGTISLAAFYGRRMRRLLPAATVVLVVVLAASYLVLPPLDRSTIMADGASAALFVSNIRFALNEGHYFTAVSTPSPFLHYWSLSLEEQFYLVWPFLLLVVARGRRVRRAAGVALLVLLGLSFAVGLALSYPPTTWGFYALPARAWQFAAGGLIAAGAARLARLPRPAALALGWAGVAVLVAALLVTGDSVPYPGLAALLPTGAAVLMIVAGMRTDGAVRLLETRPIRFLGRISYSLYLWHWPLLVLPAVLAGAPLAPPVQLALVGVAVLVAWVSWAQIETRFHHMGGPRPVATGRSLRWGAVAILGVVVLSTALGVSADSGIPNGSASGASSSGAPPTDAPPATTAPGSTAPSQEPNATPTPAPSAAGPTAPPPTPTPTLMPWTAIPDVALPSGLPLPADVRPSLKLARTDEERILPDGCVTSLEGTRPASCVYGDPAGKVTVALVGDSHASHWFPALNVLANEHGWRLIPYVKVSCPFVDGPVLNPFTKTEYVECETWRTSAIEAINRAHPDLVVVATAYLAIYPVDRDRRPQTEGAAMAREIGKLNAPAAIIVDNPRTAVDIPACLSSHPADVNACAIPRAAGFPAPFGILERVAAEASGSALVDLTATICPSMPCPVVRDGMILYRDGNHLTATFVRSLADRFAAVLLPLLPGGSGSTAGSPPPPSPSPSPGPVASAGPGAPIPAAPPPVVREAAVRIGSSGSAAGLEPIVATHPTDPSVLAVAYERPRTPTGCNGSPLEAAIALSVDAGRTWSEPAGHPWDGSRRVSSFHSAVAWGPGPAPGSSRLYWAGTTTTSCGGDLRPAVAWSDDQGTSWSGLTVMPGTPAWVGGMPDITVDRNPASPRYGTVWVAYNFPAAGRTGSGVRVDASTDFGRSWIALSLPRAEASREYPASWRFGYRVRSAPDGSAMVSWYQADLRTWNPASVFDRGSAANVGRIGFAVSRVTVAGGVLTASTPVMATTIPINPWTLGDRSAPGTSSHGYSDPMWTHGLDVDPVTGTIYLAVSEYSAPVGAGARGTIRVGRSGDGGRTWTWTEIPAAPPIGGLRQSSIRPTVAARAGIVVVGLQTIDDAGSAGAFDARIGAALAVSRDGGRTFETPAPIPGTQWRSSLLALALNGPGTRDRIDLAADGSAVFVYGDARDPDGRPATPGRSTIHLAIAEFPAPRTPGHPGWPQPL
jgi:peptidoglycan/LPS O-acetylase OafA/YrhL